MRMPDRSPVVMAAASILVAALVVAVSDAVAVTPHLARLGPLDATAGYLWILAGAIVVSTFVVTLMGFGAFAATIALKAGGHPTRARWVATFLLAAPFATATALAGVALLAGSWVAAQSWVTLARIGVVLAGVLGAWIVALVVVRHALDLATDPGRVRTRHLALVLISQLLTLVLVAVDRLVLPRHYPPFHTWTVGTAVAASGLTGAAVSGVWPRGGRVLTSLLAVAAGLILLAGAVRGTLPGESLLARDVLARAPMISRLLPLVARDAVDDDEVPAHVQAELARRPAIPPETLDEALPGRRSWNILLVTVDTVRADHLGTYGYDRNTSPRLDAFAREATVFERAWSQHPSSPLSLASMFTGIYPTATEVFRNRERGDWSIEALKEPFLADRLAAAGHRTAAFTAFPANFIDRNVSFAPKGFQSFENDAILTKDSGARVVDRARKTLREGGPWFLWVHLFDPHAPYTRRDDIDFGPTPRDLYDANIRYADEQVGRLLDALRESGAEDRTAVFFHSDHGEEFREHGGTGHHSSVYEEQIRVPLMIRLPGVAPSRVSSPVELVDLAPTILELLGQPPIEGAHGASLLPLVLDPEGKRLEAPPAVAFTQFRSDAFGSVLLDGVVRDGWKLIGNVNAGTFSLFDLAADPGEQEDLALLERDRLAEMRAWLAACRRLAGGAVERESAGGLSRAAGLENRGELAEARAVLEGIVGQDRDSRTRRAALRAMRLHRWSAAPDAVVALLASRDAELRDAAALTLGHVGDEGVSPRLADIPGEHAVIARAMLGDRTVTDRLEELAARTAGETRMETTLGLALLGDDDARSATDAWVEWRGLPEDVFVRTSRLLARRIEASTLASWYIRLLVAPTHPLANDALVEAAFAAPRECQGPLLRRLLVHAHARVRDGVEARLREAGRGAEVDALRAAETLIRVGRDQTRERRWMEAADAASAAFGAARAAGVFDWGLLLEGWFFLSTGNLHREAARRLDGALEGDVPAMAAEILGHAAALSRRADAAPRCLIEVTRADTELPAEGRRYCVGVRVSAAPDGGSLRGGTQTTSPRLVIAFSQGNDRATAKIEAFPIPVLGLRPGESRHFVAPVEVPPLAPGTWTVSAAVTASGRFLGPPVTVGTVVR